MTFLAHTDDTITLSSDSQAGKRETTSTQLFVKCPSICGQIINVETVNLARESHDRAIWNCSNCRKIKKKQVKITWHHFVCVQCTHTQGKTCLIQTCTSNCPTKQALEKKKDLGPGKAKATPMSPVASKVDRTFKRARSLIERLNKTKLVERLKVLKTAWRLGNGGMPQTWFKYKGSKKVLISRIHAGFAAFAAEPSVALPVGFQNALAEKFDFGNNVKRLGLEGKARQGAKDWKDWKAKDWKDWKWQRTAMHRKRRIFKYKDEIYQGVRNFCYTFPRLRRSTARADVENKDFPKSAYLVVPGHSFNNYRNIPEKWKNGAQDLSDLEGAAYILGQRTKPTGSHLLLVCHSVPERIETRS